MERTDFIENRIDVVKNIYTLYSYAIGTVTEDREWALQRYKMGKWYVAELFGDTLLFAPSRFVGYKNNTREKHTSNHGDGTQTNAKFKDLKLYREIADNYLSEQFESFMRSLGLVKESAKFLIPYNLDISDLQRQCKCYFICPTHCKGQKESAWKSILSQNIIAIGWNHMDYTNFTIREVEQEYKDDAIARKTFSLFKQIKDGDVICCTNNNFGLWGIGIALSQYKYKKEIHYAGIDDDGYESYYSHYIDVAWLCFKEQGYISTDELNILPSERQWPPYGTLNKREDVPLYISRYLLQNNNMENNKYEKYIKLVEANKNLILTGAPGTGKTYIAKAIAANIISNGTNDWSGLSAEQKNQVAFVQFHPSYDYTDFVEGLRPVAGGEFRRQDGVFKEFCKRALGEDEVITISNNNLFNKVYAELSDDIQNGRITKYERITAEDRGVAINDKDRLVFGPEDTHPKTISLRNLRLLFDYYVSNKQFEVSKGAREELWNAIASLTNGKTKTLDYTEYKWALNQLLSRVNKEDLDTMTISPEQDTEQQSQKPYIFIIDEINRGEISKIFGELFYAIEPDYRGEEGTVQTQYNNLVEDDDIFKSGFYVPENVYIIGTMNDVDRGVEAMDFAIRRRFGWKEVTAEESAENMGITGLARVKMNALNKSLLAHNLTKAHCIGGAYFRKLEGDDFKALWDYHLEGIIFEYFRGEPDAQNAIEEIKKDYFDAKLPENTTKKEESVSTEEGSAE